MMRAGPQGSAAHLPEKIKTSSGPLNLSVKEAQREKIDCKGQKQMDSFLLRIFFRMTFVVTSKPNLYLLTEGWKLSAEERKSGSD